MEQKQQNVPKSVTNFTAQTTKDLYFSRTAKSPNYSRICDTGMMSSELLRCINILKKKIKENGKKKKFITLSFTSNVISSGLRQCIVDMMPWIKCIVTTTGAIEEDIIKTSWEFQISDYYNAWRRIEQNQTNKQNDDVQSGQIMKDDLINMKDASYSSIGGNILRDNGYNRIGNILVHNSCYISFEQYLLKQMSQIELEYPTTAEFCRFITPQGSLLEDLQMQKGNFDDDETDAGITVEEKIESLRTSSKIQNTISQSDQLEKNNIKTTDSTENDTLGNNVIETGSFLQCAKSQNVPVFISAIGDGSIGDVFTFSKPMKFKGIDGLRDFKEFINESKNTLGLSLGTGVILSKMRFLDQYILITSNDKDDGASYYNQIDNPRIISDLSIVLPIIVKEIFLSQNDSL